MPTGNAADRLRSRSGEELLVITVLGTPAQRRDVRRELERRSRTGRSTTRGGTTEAGAA